MKKYKQQVKKLTQDNEGVVVHVRVESPLIMRKNILNCALDSARLLKTYSEIKDLKRTKDDILIDLTEVNSELRGLMKYLERKLPELPHEGHIEEKQEIKVSPVKINIKNKVETNEIDQLKAELEQIEKKLKNL